MGIWTPEPTLRGLSESAIRDNGIDITAYCKMIVYTGTEIGITRYQTANGGQFDKITDALYLKDGIIKIGNSLVIVGCNYYSDGRRYAMHYDTESNEQRQGIIPIYKSPFDSSMEIYIDRRYDVFSVSGGVPIRNQKQTASYMRLDE
jgi:hypothetical protein